MPYELNLLGVSSHVWVGIDQLTFQPTFSNTWWHILMMFIFIVRQLHHSEDNPLLHKLGVDKWSDKGRRTLGISGPWRPPRPSSFGDNDLSSDLYD